MEAIRRSDEHVSGNRSQKRRTLPTTSVSTASTPSRSSWRLRRYGPLSSPTIPDTTCSHTFPTTGVQHRDPRQGRRHHPQRYVPTTNPQYLTYILTPHPATSRQGGRVHPQPARRKLKSRNGNMSSFLHKLATTCTNNKTIREEKRERGGGRGRDTITTPWIMSV